MTLEERVAYLEGKVAMLENMVINGMKYKHGRYTAPPTLIPGSPTIEPGWQPPNFVPTPGPWPYKVTIKDSTAYED